MRGGSCLRTALCLTRGRRWSRGGVVSLSCFAGLGLVQCRGHVMAGFVILCQFERACFFQGIQQKGREGSFSGPDTGGRDGEAVFFPPFKRKAEIPLLRSSHYFFMSYPFVLFSFVLVLSRLVYLFGRDKGQLGLYKDGSCLFLAFRMIHWEECLFLRPCFENHSHAPLWLWDDGSFGYTWCCGVDVTVMLV